MSNNREQRIHQDYIHLFLALQRKPKSGNKKCFRTVIIDEELDLKIVEAKCKVMGGEWRIHKTVNARNVEKARKWLIKHLIDYPENASFADSAWRTALLQREFKSEDYFMLDIDTQDLDKLKTINNLIDIVVQAIMDENRGMICYGGNHPLIREKIKSPKGWHYITNRFDTREVCKLEYVTLLRDGYYYVKTVGE